MDYLDSFANFSRYLTHPLVLAGFVLLLFFGIHASLIRSGIIPPLSAHSGSRVVQTLLRYGFVIAVLVVVLGFTLEFFKTQSRAALVGDEIAILVERADKVLEYVEEGPAAEPFRTRVIAEKDRVKADELVRDAESVLDKAGLGTKPDDYYLLGTIFLNLGQYDHAAASFLAAVDVKPEWGKAYLGLAQTYQLQGNSYTRTDNFGLAEGALDKATLYAKTALQYNTADSAVHVQLGYVYKELAQRYTAIGKQDNIKDSLDNASSHFSMALGLDENDASAHNGLASVHIIRGHYVKAINESKRAIELSPMYLFAHYDLSMAYFGKFLVSTSEKERLSATIGFLESYKSLLGLDGKPGAGKLPVSARQDIDGKAKMIRAETALLTEKVQTATQESQHQDGNTGRPNTSQNLITHVVYFDSKQVRLARQLTNRLEESGFANTLSSSSVLPAVLRSGVVPRGNSICYYLSVPKEKVKEVRSLVGEMLNEASFIVYDGGFIPLAGGTQWLTEENEILVVFNE